MAGEEAKRSTAVPRPPRSGATIAPTFTSAFADKVVFVNTIGEMLPCTAAGRPAPAVEWIWADNGRPVVSVHGLLEPLGNGSLRFLPFADAAYSEAVHSAVSLRCRATNDVGTVVSKLVRVRAGECPTYLVPYDPTDGRKIIALKIFIHHEMVEKIIKSK